MSQTGHSEQIVVVFVEIKDVVLNFFLCFGCLLGCFRCLGRRLCLFFGCGGRFRFSSRWSFRRRSTSSGELSLLGSKLLFALACLKRQGTTAVLSGFALELLVP